MLSDTLHDAVEEIERYEKEDPQIYAQLAGVIAEVKTAMRTLQAILDQSIPVDDPELFTEVLRNVGAMYGMDICDVRNKIINRTNC